MENEKSPSRAFFVLLFSFPLPVCSFTRILPYKHINIKNKRYGFFSISLVLLSLIETGWNLPCKQVLRIMKRLRHGKYLSMISFLPTQCMIFSTRFVVQSAKDFHPCKPIQKAATSHAKQKRQRLHPYRLMFIFCQRRRHDCCRTFSLLKSVHGIISPVSNLLAAASNEKQSGKDSTHTA